MTRLTTQCLKIMVTWLTFTILWTNSADDKLTIVFLFFPESRFRNFMQIVDSQEMSKPVFWEKQEKYFNMSPAENFIQSVKRLNKHARVKFKFLKLLMKRCMLPRERPWFPATVCLRLRFACVGVVN